MGRARAGQVGPLAPPRGGGAQVALQEPTLERAFGGDAPVERRLEEVDADQAGPPGRVLASQPQGGPDGVGGLGPGGRGLMIIGRDALNPTPAKPRQEAADGRARQPEGFRNLVRLTAPPRELKDGLAQGDGCGSWHDRRS